MAELETSGYCHTCLALTDSMPYERIHRCYEQGHEDCLLRVITRQCTRCYLTKSVVRLHSHIGAQHDRTA